MFRAHAGMSIAAKALYAVGCVAAAATLGASGLASYVVKSAESFGGSDVITGGPSTGAMNILLMGLESRTDYEGNVLSSQLLTAMHAGSVQGVEDDGVGGQDTNTLILIHIFAGGKKAVGYSIPRDDWVTFPQAYDGQSEGKIDNAYGLAYSQSLSQTVNDTSMSRQQRYLMANDAGQAATIATVEAVTGQHIDHFAEMNLAGFFSLAQIFGGIEVCLKSYNGGENLHDANSGFNVATPGYHLLAADQALAFVRERDNLPNGDLDRTHRQQAVIDYVIWKLEHQGILTSLSQLTSLINVAKKYVITDQGWQILQFASEMHALTGKNLTFQTLPIEGYHTFYIGGQAEDANLIDIPAIQAEVKQAFTAPAPSDGKPAAKSTTPASLSPAQTTVDVFNGGNTNGLAGDLSQALTQAGFKAGKVGDIPAQSSTQVLYGTGAAASAATIAGYFDGITAAPSSSVAPGHVEVELGADATSVPTDIGSAAAGSGSASPAPSATSPSASATSAANNGAAGGTVSVPANAPYGIPCVY